MFLAFWVEMAGEHAITLEQIRNGSVDLVIDRAFLCLVVFFTLFSFDLDGVSL